MYVLALDTTTRSGSVAITHDGNVLSVIEGDEQRTHGERLPGEIALALKGAALAPERIDLLVVASGPGAFTGLRIGLAAVQGLAMVLHRPVIGVSALDALAAHAWPRLRDSAGESLTIWMDAQRGEVFSATYDPAPGGPAEGCRLRGPAIVGHPAAVLAAQAETARPSSVFAGDGALRYEAVLREWSNLRLTLIPPPTALAPYLARLGSRGAGDGNAGAPHTLQPLYIRRPDAEIDRRRRRGDGP
ncbi:MAG: tRNA (adenosine(37)-N6)-threonylcarbamoyltransferase complex dimerization subunit type 1 TsaB [Acidobacteriota bacterium]